MKKFRVLFLIALMAEVGFFLSMADRGIDFLPIDTLERNGIVSDGHLEPEVHLYLTGPGPRMTQDSGVAAWVLIIAEAQRVTLCK
jgi:hypothetical protein